jgi:glycosyltransferase involved in cell wall biosynthesis
MVAACPFPFGRGTPIRIQREAEALAARGHEVHVVTYSLGAADPVAGVIVDRTPRLPLYRQTSPGPTWQKLLFLDPMLAAKLMRLVRRQRFDIVHAHHYEGLLVAMAATRFVRIPVVYDAHTMLGSELAFFQTGLPRPFTAALGRGLDRWLPRLADHVISVTETIRDHLVDSGALTPARIAVVPNGVECERFGSAMQPSWQADTLKRVIFTGNLAPYQGIEALLAAFAEVARHRRDVRLLIVTESDFSSYRPTVRRLGIEDLIESLPAPPFADLPALLETAHIAANPRLEADGMPVKLLNYMAAGKPIVSFKSSAPGLMHGDTAWLVASSDPVEFGRGIMTLLGDADRALAMGRRARRFVEDHYRWPLRAEQIERVYEAVLERA